MEWTRIFAFYAFFCNVNLFFSIIMKSLSSLREAIIRAHDRGKTVMEIADFLGISHSTVSKAIKRFEETGSNEDRHGRGRKKSARSKRNILRAKGMIKLSLTQPSNR